MPHPRARGELSANNSFLKLCSDSCFLGYVVIHNIDYNFSMIPSDTPTRQITSVNGVLDSLLHLLEQLTDIGLVSHLESYIIEVVCTNISKYLVKHSWITVSIHSRCSICC